MAIITKEHAQKIVKKLGAEIETKQRSGAGKAHTTALIYHNGILIAQFGIRHGSNKDQSHDHIRNDLHVSPRQALNLARCPLTQLGWLAITREKGLLPEGADVVEEDADDAAVRESNGAPETNGEGTEDET